MTSLSRRRESQIKGIESEMLDLCLSKKASSVAEENPRLRELKDLYLSLEGILWRSQKRIPD